MKDHTIIIAGNNFVDNKERIFIPYKGWMKLTESGHFIKDELTIKNEGYLKIVPDPVSHGNWHTLYNLLDNDGKKILPNGVRRVTYFEEGYYLLEDNNEDELINRGDIKGGFYVKDYIERANILFNDGRLLSQEWFDRIMPSVIGYFKIIKNGQSNYVDYSGSPFSNISNNIIGFDGNAIYTYKNGFLTRRDKEDNRSVKKLKKFAESGEIRIGRQLFNLIGNDNSAVKKFLSNLRCENIIIDNLSSENGRFNLLTKDGYLFFEDWYEKISRFYEDCGVLVVKKDGKWKLINIFEQNLEENTYDSIHFTSNYIICCKKNQLSIITTSLRHLQVDCDSVMWKDSLIWGMNIFNKGKLRHFFHGEAEKLIAYAYEVLNSNPKSLIIGKNGMWSLYNDHYKIKPLFKFN